MAALPFGGGIPLPLLRLCYCRRAFVGKGRTIKEEHPSEATRNETIRIDFVSKLMVPHFQCLAIIFRVSPPLNETCGACNQVGNDCFPGETASVSQYSSGSRRWESVWPNTCRANKQVWCLRILRSQIWGAQQMWGKRVRLTGVDIRLFSSDTCGKCWEAT